jgi:hypothetical protein
LIEIVNYIDDDNEDVNNTNNSNDKSDLIMGLDIYNFTLKFDEDTKTFYPYYEDDTIESFKNSIEFVEKIDAMNVYNPEIDGTLLQSACQNLPQDLIEALTGMYHNTKKYIEEQAIDYDEEKTLKDIENFKDLIPLNDYTELKHLLNSPPNLKDYFDLREKIRKLITLRWTSQKNNKKYIHYYNDYILFQLYYHF